MLLQGKMCCVIAEKKKNHNLPMFCKCKPAAVIIEMYYMPDIVKKVKYNWVLLKGSSFEKILCFILKSLEFYDYDHLKIILKKIVCIYTRISAKI